jgi:glycosyltransferase involved in cell wall biosynthesis
MVRLLLASYNYPPSIGGVERQSHLLARGLMLRGHQVRVIAARLPGFPAAEEVDSIRIQRVSAGSGSRWQKMATYVAGMLLATRQSGAWADVIHVQQVLYPAAAMALLASAYRKPLVVTNAGSGDFGGVQLMRRLPLGRLSLGLIARAAYGVSLNAEMTHEMQDAGFRRLRQIPNGVELPPETTPEMRMMARQNLGIDGLMVLYVGRLEQEKGVDLLIRAWQQVEVPGVKLIIVGDGPERDSFARLARSAPGQRAIDLAGPTTDVRTYFQAADLFVLPSRSEGISYALLEAMASGLAVVATDVGGNREVICDASVGTLVRPLDPPALTEAVTRLLLSQEIRKANGAAARAHVQSSYSAERMVAAYEQLYLSLLSGA